MIDKTSFSLQQSIAQIKDGATILVSGFGGAGSPIDLLHALLDHGASELTIVSNNTGNGEIGLAALIANGRVTKFVCSYPRSSNGWVFAEAYHSKRVELEVVPQGTLAERIRAGGAGIPAFYTPTTGGTLLAEGKEQRAFYGRPHVLETAIRGDIALIKAAKADTLGNLIYSKTARNFGPIMATAADCTITQVQSVVERGELDPESIATPSIFVDHVVCIAEPLSEANLISQKVVRMPK